MNRAEKLYLELMDARREEEQVTCQQYPEAWFPEQGENGMVHKWAKQSCFECPIKKPCLDYALEANEIGIWGGTSYVERQEMRRYLKIA